MHKFTITLPENTGDDTIMSLTSTFMSMGVPFTYERSGTGDMHLAEVAVPSPPVVASSEQSGNVSMRISKHHRIPGLTQAQIVVNHMRKYKSATMSDIKALLDSMGWKVIGAHSCMSRLTREVKIIRKVIRKGREVYIYIPENDPGVDENINKYFTYSGRAKNVAPLSLVQKHDQEDEVG